MIFGGNMRQFQKLLFVLGFTLFACAQTQAATVAEQIVSAIASSDYALVQTLVKSNPNMTGKAEDTLLKKVLGNVVDKPQGAAKTMSTASVIAPGITPADARTVAEGLRKVVKLIADKQLLICNPEAQANVSDTQTAPDPKKVADAKAVASILDSAEDIAKTPAIVAIDPKLFAEIDAQRAQCQTGDEALLAQSPSNRPGHQRPNIIPPIIPPVNPASPD